MVERFEQNPLIGPEDAEPSREGLEVVGTFNPAAFELGGRIGLLVRVAERPLSEDPGTVLAPVFDMGRHPPTLETIPLGRDDPAWDFSDPRVVAPAPGGPAAHYYLTNASHLRLAWSDDGRRFEFGGASAAWWPEGPDERFGIEDARVTKLGDLCLVTYSAVSARGICVGLRTTKDFRLVGRHGVIFGPENKDVCLFPEKLDGDYVALHRPSGAWCRPGIWIARGPDMVHWGRHAFVAGPRPGTWDSLRIGAGPPPLRTAAGWLVIYHGAGERGYCLGAMLLDRDDPARVLARSEEPFLVPEAEYEKGGFFDDAVFCNGLVERPDGELWLYYGAADRVTAGCRCASGELLDSLR